MTENIEDTQPGKKAANEALTAPTPEPGRPARSQMGRPVDYWLLWLVALGSIALNVWLINTLLTIQRDIEAARLELAQGIAEAANGVGQASLGTFEYSVEVNESIPLDIQVPISDTFRVPISETVRVNSVAFANLPLIGRQPIPFSVAVPIDLEVAIPISRTYVVTDTIPVNFTVPVKINLDETPLGELKGELQAYLIELANELGQPAGGQPSP